QGVDPEKPARNRRPVRRTRPHDGAARRAQDLGCPGQAGRAQPYPARVGTNSKRMTMQLVQTTRDALLKPLSTVAGIVERRHTLPILANIRVRKEGSRVSFIATDLEVQITTHADFGVGDSNESTTVAARKLVDILRALPDTGDLKLSLASGKLT